MGKRTRREVKAPNTVLISLLKTRLMFVGHKHSGNQAKVKYTRMPKPPGQSYSGSSMANILPAFTFPPSPWSSQWHLAVPATPPPLPPPLALISQCPGASKPLLGFTPQACRFHTSCLAMNFLSLNIAWTQLICMP